MAMMFDDHGGLSVTQVLAVRLGAPLIFLRIIIGV